MEQLEFFGKSMARGGNDIQITHSFDKNKNEVTYMTFRNNVHERIAPNTDCITYAVSGTRIYFKEASPAVGYRLSFNRQKDSVTNATRRYVSPSGSRHQKLHAWAEKYGGEYDLCYDGSIGLWCIDANGLQFNGKAGLTV